MGARIAAHFANAGLPCVLLDMVPPDLRSRRAGVRSEIGLPVTEWKQRRKSRPAAFF